MGDSDEERQALLTNEMQQQIFLSNHAKFLSMGGMQLPIPVVNVQQNDGPAVDGGGAFVSASRVRDWAGRLNSRLQKDDAPFYGGDTPTATMCRVPIPLRDGALENYVPKFVALGLYGHDTPTDPSLDVFRLDFARIFMAITGKSWNAVVELVGSSGEDWVKLYGDYNLEDEGLGGAAGSKLNEDDIKVLLALDSVFVACFIQGYHQLRCKHADCPSLPALNKVMVKDALRPSVHLILLDMFKFENQIPLHLLEKFVDEMMFSGAVTSRIADPFTKFLTDVVDLIYCDLPGPSRRERSAPLEISEGLKGCNHLLHCLYKVICYKPPKPEKSSPAGGLQAQASMEKTMTPVSQQKYFQLNRFLPRRLSTRISMDRDGGDGLPTAQDQDDMKLSSLPQVGQTATVKHDHHIVKIEANQSWTDFFKGRHQRKPHRPRIHIPTVTQLREAGIRVAVGDTHWISEVRFESSRFQGTLYIPALSVYDETGVLLNNLLTFEYVVVKNWDLVSYVHLMVNLINTEEDVKLMRESGVLENNSLGSDARMAKMWNEMLSPGIVVNLSDQYLGVYHQIADHYESTYNRWAGELFGLYFKRKPWLLIGVAVVLVTAIGTLLGMIFTLLTYYYGNKQRKP